MSALIQLCSAAQFKEVKFFIERYELDNRQLQQQEFLIIQNNSELLGFGRIRDHQCFSELCSLGIVEKHRNKNYGTQLTKALIQKAKQPLYLVCIIPDYFTPLGFSVCEIYPDEIAEKLNYCTQSLPVKEKYVAMKMG